MIYEGVWSINCIRVDLFEVRVLGFCIFILAIVFFLFLGGMWYNFISFLSSRLVKGTVCREL